MSTALARPGSTVGRRRGFWIVAALAVLLGVYLMMEFVLGHRGPTVNPSGQAIIGVVQSVTADKICIKPDNVDVVCGAMARQPGLDVPAAGDIARAEVYEVPIRDSNGGEVGTVTFLILTRAGLTS